MTAWSRIIDGLIVDTTRAITLNISSNPPHEVRRDFASLRQKNTRLIAGIFRITGGGWDSYDPRKPSPEASFLIWLETRIRIYIRTEASIGADRFFANTQA